MATTFPFERVRHYLVPALASLIGLGVAVGIATVPSDVLNAAVDRAGVSGILPAAASPIGATGRTLLALLAGALIAACGFVPQLKAMLVSRVDAYARRPRGEDDVGTADAPVVRRADAHPDAPPRRPIRAASDLGAPLPIFGEEDRRSAPLPPPVVQSLPDDLDRPLADFDPAAVPLRPMAPPEPVAPLVRAAEPPAPVPRFAWLAPEEADEPPATEVSQPAGIEPPAADAPVVPSPETDPHQVAAPAEWSTAVSPVAEPSAIQPRVATPAPASPPESSPSRVAVPTDWSTTVPADVSPLPEPVIQPRVVAPATAPHPAAAEPFTPAPAASPSTAEIEDDSIAGLLARLERGAAQRRTIATAAPVTPAPTPAPAPAPAADPEPVSLDATLQRLRRLAAG